MGADPAAEVASAPDEDMDEDVICRYCLDGTESGELISPCECKGGQKYVHLSCLRQWQRMVLVSQPTHPALYGDDIRHQTCNVCKTSFTCPPPTRHELMQSFTGHEIAALIETGCVIGAHEIFSKELENKLEEMPEFARSMCGYDNWIHGVYLITGVDVEDGIQRLPLTSKRELERLRRELSTGLAISARGNQFRLIPEGSLSGVKDADLGVALSALEPPCELVLIQDPKPDCGDDHITAVGLQRQLRTPIRQNEVDRVLQSVCSKYPRAKKVELSYFIGGPCDKDRIVSCLVLGASHHGWKSVEKLEDALHLACSLQRRQAEQGDFGCGQTVRLHGLQGRADLNDEVGLTLQFLQGPGRWMVRLRNGDGVKVKPGNLEGIRGEHGQVYIFWGDARWSRTQLLGEIARGHWGLGKASIADLSLPAADRWRGLDGRLAFAPETAMTEDFMRDGSQQMARLRALARDHGVGDGEASGDDN